MKAFEKNKVFKHLAVGFMCVFLCVLSIGIYIMNAQGSGRLSTFFGYAVLNPITKSMEPTIPVGSYFLVKKVAPEKIKKGDIIVFYSKEWAIYGCINTHRVVKEPYFSQDGTRLFITKGDNNPIPDSMPVREDQVIARFVRFLPWLDSLGEWIKSPIFLIVCVVLQIMWFSLSGIIFTMRKNIRANEQELRNQIAQRAVSEYIANSANKIQNINNKKA